LILSLVANVVAAGWFFLSLGERVGGHRYDISKAGDLTILRRLTYQYEPLLQTLEKYRQAHAKYPGNLNEVEFSQPHYLQDVNDTYPLAYSLNDDRQGFRLYLKLGWDPALRYDSTMHQWKYDPGDGTEEALIPP
jgi:hypothetical protein